MEKKFTEFFEEHKEALRAELVTMIDRLLIHDPNFIADLLVDYCECDEDLAENLYSMPDEDWIRFCREAEVFFRQSLDKVTRVD